MKFKLFYGDNKLPVLTEFEGTQKELSFLLKLNVVMRKNQ